LKDKIKNVELRKEIRLKIMNVIRNKFTLIAAALIYWSTLISLWYKGQSWFFADKQFPILVVISLIFSVWSIWHLMGIVSRSRDSAIRIAKMGQLGQIKSKGEKKLGWQLRVATADVKLISSAIAMSLIALVIIAEFLIIFPNQVEDGLSQFNIGVYELIVAVLFVTPIIAYVFHKLMRKELRRHG
jgi:hypothetical protein